MNTTPSMISSSSRQQRTKQRSFHNVPSNPAFQVTKQAKRTGGSIKLTHVTLHILTSENGFVINLPGASEMTNKGTSKYPRRQKISGKNFLLFIYREK